MAIQCHQRSLISTNRTHVLTSNFLLLYLRSICISEMNLFKFWDESYLANAGVLGLSDGKLLSF